MSRTRVARVPVRAVLAIALVVLGAMQPGSAGTVRSRRYDLGAVGMYAGVHVPVKAGGIERTIGSVRFPLTRWREPHAARISVWDDVSPAVGVTVCYDRDRNGCIIGTQDTILYIATLGAGGNLALRVAGYPALTVSVGAGACAYLMGFLIPFPCGAGVATSGVVTLTEFGYPSRTSK